MLASSAGTRRCTLRLPTVLARRLDACCARHPDTPRDTLLLRLLEAGLRQAESPPRAAAAASQATQAPLPHRRLRAQSAVYLPTSPYAALHGLRPRHHLALEQSLDAALEGEGGEAVGLPAGPAIGVSGSTWPGATDYRLDEE